MKSPERRRWWICALLFAASAIAYIDRQTFAVVAPVVAGEFHLDNKEVAHILSSFLLAYTFGQLLAGRFFDRVESGIAFVISIGLWSLANALTALATGFWGFAGCRFALGVGESGNFPGGVKVIAEWFTPAERAFAGGLFTSGASVGGLLAGPLVAGVAHRWGWRAAFLVTGSLGFLWLVGWLCVYRSSQQPMVADAPAPAGAGAGAARSALEHDGAEPTIRWVDLFKHRQVCSLAIARFLEEPAFWVWMLWLPKYVVDIRGLSLPQAGWLLVLPFLALDVGYVSGGWISTRLVRRGWSVERSKRAVMIAGALLMMSSIPAAFSSNVWAFATLVSFCLAGHGAWFANALTIPSDVAPRRLVASFYGITALGGGLGGIIATEATGSVVDAYRSFTAIFLAAGILPMLATAVLVLVAGSMTPFIDEAERRNDPRRLP